MSRVHQSSGYVFPMPGRALVNAWREGYTLAKFKRDVMAGLTIGVVAVPLSMALAIATGVPPQHGLYTAIVAGAVIALTGGSRFNISGPTAAFVVILFPIVANHGLGGLLIATFMAGAILVALGLSRLGSLIQYVPYPVILGFTAGIGVVIALLQLPDFLGLAGVELGDSTLRNLMLIGRALPTLSLAEISVGLVTLATLLIWPRLNTPVPAPLVGLAVGTLVAALLLVGGVEVDTIASRFSWEYQGESGSGIPPFAPGFIAPWHFPGADGTPLEIDFALIQALLGPALAIALLAAIESLLCAVVADGLTRTRHDPNAELIGQGLGNMVVPFFGGITATAALARTATNIKSGAFSPIAAVVHSVVVLLAVVVLAGVLGYVPMAALAALLFIIAWNMSEAHKAVRLLRRAPLGEVLVFLTCFSLTVFLDMVVAITVGVLLAALLFMREIAAMTRISDITHSPRLRDYPIPGQWGVLKIVGPLFFAAADRVFAEADELAAGRSGVVLYMDGVSVLDGGGVSALQGFVDRCAARGCQVVVADLGFQPLKTLARAGMAPQAEQLRFSPSLDEALKTLT